MSESKEAVALELLRAIAVCQGKATKDASVPGGVSWQPDDSNKDYMIRDWILEMYRACLEATSGERLTVDRNATSSE